VSEVHVICFGLEVDCSVDAVAGGRIIIAHIRLADLIQNWRLFGLVTIDFVQSLGPYSI
jgi:hypothetical protein